METLAIDAKGGKREAGNIAAVSLYNDSSSETVAMYLTQKNQVRELNKSR